MDRILVISDDPRRSRGLTRDLTDGLTCVIHDLYDDAPAARADVVIADIYDFRANAVERACRLLDRMHRGTPLVLLLHHESPRARMFGHGVHGVGRILRETGLTAGRLGGEEFAMLMPGHGLAGAAAEAHSVRSQCAASVVPGLPELRFTASIGLSEWSAGGGIDSLLKRADVALYAAKRGGRDRVAVTGSDMEPAMVG